MTDLENRLAALRAAFVERMEGDMTLLAAAIAAEPVEREEAIRIAHRFAGAAGLYGFGALGEAASALEAELIGGAGREALERCLKVMHLASTAR